MKLIEVGKCDFKRASEQKKLSKRVIKTSCYSTLYKQFNKSLTTHNSVQLFFS